ncbi:iron-sulfur cluster assembly accessory protein [Pseudacidovorax intermedius]|uniref:Iron-sulfur cluster assembly accessory protein n=1 Tax=Pseudacidovorax intermedius TaxID=433924 RepID=A0A370FCM7_9BURK|nr:iron-sulfur cluster biosynthesis family protein [Pseudacidovorax intermedius]RDI23476.1 iron-sulfur cluster assembly accessory protein [Pseudacidovorax intermedius]
MVPSLTLTPAAEKFVRRILRFSGLPATAGFRLVVSAGGCSGFNSEFSAEAAPQPGESVLEVGEGLRLFLPAESRLLLDGVTMDFVDTPTKSGLAFIDPKQAPCACSSSGDVAATPPGVARIDVGSIGRGRPATLTH